MENEMIKVKLYNTLTKAVEDFAPMKAGQVGMYVCGPTVYDKSHIGHARTYIFFDFLRRYLEFKGNSVKLIINLTDIDDRIINRLQKNEAEFPTWQVVKDVFSRDYFSTMAQLRIKPPFTFPQVTDHMQEVISMVQTLIDGKFAYEAGDGIYFDVNKFSDYGKLSGRADTSHAQARVDENENKRSQQDFALWKFHKPGEPFWHAPFGAGRPGWHIECSAMARTYLGPTFDIHGGGADLVFPHHENEIAQSESANGAPFARFWVHTAFLTIDQTKMSKSLGNFVTIQDMLTKYPPELVRYYLLSAHYRTPLDFSWEKLDAARLQWDKLVRAWYETIQKTESKVHGRTDSVEAIESARKDLMTALDNDLSTPEAYAVIHRVVGMVAQGDLNAVSLKTARQFFETVDDIFAILPPPNWTKREEKLARMLAELREYFRRGKEFNISDEVREHLRKEGVELDDSKEGSKIRFV
ncbi:MAG TPA: cysteine--tRNA ligase [archaeon]|nr:cysteine--tRNA ligase [archaeon]